MSEIHQVVKVDSTRYNVSLKKTIKDINDVDVVVPDGVLSVTLVEVDAQIAYYQAKITDYQGIIAFLEEQKFEINKI